jgi:probable rRNA maturation factor
VSLPEVAACLPGGGAAAAACTLRLTGDRELRRLNRSFLREDRVTDVLAFPADGGNYLGDIAISWPAARRQAAELGHGSDVELAFLAVHGLLHLLGWDHARPEEAREMDDLQAAVLAVAGLPRVGDRLRG